VQDELRHRAAGVGRLLMALSVATASASDSGAQSTTTRNLARCESLLVSQQTAAATRKRLPDAIERDVTSFLLHVHARNGGQLTYVGVRHSFDPADSQFVSMQHEFDVLKPTIVFYEGTGTTVRTTAEDAVRKDGEPGLARFLASTAGIPVRSLEPARADEVRMLLQNFSPEDLVMFFTLRPVMELRTRLAVAQPRLDSALARQLASVHRIPSLQNALPDTAALRSAFTRTFPGIDLLALPPDWFAPVQSSEKTAKSLFNAINYASSMFRDTYMYRQLASSALVPDARVFAEVGRDHIPAQAPALTCALDGGG
jgi:hypothetical protein